MEVGLAVGGAVLSSALNVFFDRMTPKFPSLFRGRRGEEQLLRKLKITLLAANAVLSDAEDKQDSNRDVKQWLRELKDTVYDAEDLVDEINTEVLRLEVEGGDQKGMTYTICITSTSAGWYQIFLWRFHPKIIGLSNFSYYWKKSFIYNVSDP